MTVIIITVMIIVNTMVVLYMIADPVVFAKKELCD